MSTPLIARAELVRMGGSAGLGQYLPAEGGLPGTWWGTNLESLERFAHLVIEDFLSRSGQYLTNDASREAAIAEAVAAEREACEADAARYRWLRDVSVPPHNFYLSVPEEFDGVRYEPHEVDAYIDAAMRARGAS